jgi:hypothetical protein
VRHAHRSASAPTAIGRFTAGGYRYWDSRGRQVQGGSPLATLAFARAGADRIAVGEPAVSEGAIEAPAAAPVLDGPKAPTRRPR